MDISLLETEKAEFLKHLILNREDKIKAEELSRNRIKSNLWKKQRLKRLTASIFGEICKKGRTCSLKSLVRGIIYPTEIFSKSLNYGKIDEDEALKE